MYADAYLEYLRSRPTLVELLCEVACDVYDNDPGNVASELDFARQTPGLGTHLQDIAIRQALVRLGRAFRGSQLVQIRGQYGQPPIHPLARQLSPQCVPFHRPDWIVRPVLAGWWTEDPDAIPDSVETFYQSNRYLEVKVI